MKTKFIFYTTSLCVLFSIVHCKVQSTKYKKDLNILSVNGVDLHYKVYGTGVPLLFLHAGMLDHNMWYHQVRYFSPDYQVITYDLRGHGHSKIKDTINDYEYKDIYNLLEHLQIEQVNIVGCSLGAIVATDFAVVHPERVQKLVLLSPGLNGYLYPDSIFFENMKEYVAAAQQEDWAIALEHTLKIGVCGPNRNASEVDAGIVKYAKKRMETYLKSGQYLRQPQLLNPPAKERLANIQCPVLLICGGKDFEYVQKNIALLKQYLPYAQKEVMPQAAHLANMEFPKTFNKILKNFLE